MIFLLQSSLRILVIWLVVTVNIWHLSVFSSSYQNIKKLSDAQIVFGYKLLKAKLFLKEVDISRRQAAFRPESNVQMCYIYKKCHLQVQNHLLKVCIPE